MVIISSPQTAGPSQQKDYAFAYSSILASSRSSTSPILLLVSPDVDALAATRILTGLLTEDDIAYHIIPISGYRNLLTVLREDVEDNHALRTVVLINLGSVLSLPTTVPLPEGCTLHVVDSHRPWNLENLFATGEVGERIWIWDDGEIEGMESERLAFERLEFDVEDSDSEEESEDEQDEEDEDEQGDTGSKRRRSGSPEGSESPNRHKKAKQDRLSAIERNRLRNLLSRYYNRGTQYGMSVASIMYLLCTSLGRRGRDSLWLAIVGLSSQFLSSSIDSETYASFASAYASEALALAPATDADTRSIQVSPSELRFTLYRHWSLETSMYHTPYVAGKLGIWREKGMSKLRGMMAKMGFSLSSVRQSFTHMPLDLRHTLVDRLEAIAPEYGMTDLTYKGFVRNFGYGGIAAADVVEGAGALLVAAHGVKIEVDTPGLTFGTVLAASNTANGAATSSEMFGSKRTWSLGDENDEQPAWHRNFFQAYKSLASTELMRSSLLLSQALHHAVLTRGIGLITNQSIRTLKNFRLAVLKDGNDLELFAHVDVLARLARWLVDALRDIVKTDKPLPFVLAALDAENDTFLVLGQTGSPHFGEVEPNKFGLAFQTAAQRSGARVRHDRFETAAVEVRKADLAQFIESVHLKIR